MIYLYERAMCKDLEQSFDVDAMGTPSVRVVDPEHAIELAAQIKNDQVSFPLISRVRAKDIDIDSQLRNFTKMHFGSVTVMDPETNNLYYEKSMPLSLKYSLIIYATNIADMDEIIKELLFKYSDTYFLTLELPYECKRKVRFGVVRDYDSSIESTSARSEYLAEGKVYLSAIPLKLEGCVLVSYTPVHLKQMVVDNSVHIES